MSTLYLLRHAKAAWPAPGMKDFDRPLDAEGQDSLAKLAQSMLAARLLPERIVLSGSFRTRQTASGLVDRLGQAIETVIDERLYNGNAADYIQSIRQYGDVGQLMLVGHNPSIEDLALALSGDGNSESLMRLKTGFPTAGLAQISFKKPLSDIERGDGFLESFPTPLAL